MEERAQIPDLLVDKDNAVKASGSRLAILAVDNRAFSFQIKRSTFSSHDKHEYIGSFTNYLLAVFDSR